MYPETDLQEKNEASEKTQRPEFPCRATAEGWDERQKLYCKVVDFVFEQKRRWGEYYTIEFSFVVALCIFSPEHFRRSDIIHLISPLLNIRVVFLIIAPANAAAKLSFNM